MTDSYSERIKKEVNVYMGMSESELLDKMEQYLSKSSRDAAGDAFIIIFDVLLVTITFPIKLFLRAFRKTSKIRRLPTLSIDQRSIALQKHLRNAQTSICSDSKVTTIFRQGNIVDPIKTIQLISDSLGDSSRIPTTLTATYLFKLSFIKSIPVPKRGD